MDHLCISQQHEEQQLSGKVTGKLGRAGKDEWEGCSGVRTGYLLPHEEPGKEGVDRGMAWNA